MPSVELKLKLREASTAVTGPVAAHVTVRTVPHVGDCYESTTLNVTNPAISTQLTVVNTCTSYLKIQIFYTLLT